MPVESKQIYFNKQTNNFLIRLGHANKYFFQKKIEIDFNIIFCLL